MERDCSHSRGGRHAHLRLIFRQQRRITLVVGRIEGHGERSGKLIRLADLANRRRLSPQRFNQLAQVVVIHAHRAIGRIQKSAGRIWRTGLNHQDVATILIGNRCLTPHRFKDDHAKLAELASVVGRSATRPHNAPHAILARRRVSIGLQRRARGVPVLARSEIVRTAAHRIRARQLASGVILQNQPTHPVTVRRQNNFNRRHECYPLLVSPASAHISRDSHATEVKRSPAASPVLPCRASKVFASSFKLA